MQEGQVLTAMGAQPVAQPVVVANTAVGGIRNVTASVERAIQGVEGGLAHSLFDHL